MNSTGLRTKVKREELWCKNCIYFVPYEKGYGYCKKLYRGVRENWTCNNFENAHGIENTLERFSQGAVEDA